MMGPLSHRLVSLRADYVLLASVGAVCVGPEIVLLEVDWVTERSSTRVRERRVCSSQMMRFITSAGRLEEKQNSGLF